MLTRWLIPTLLSFGALLQGSPGPGLPPKKAAAGDIRSVDFRNFDFPIVRRLWLDTPLHLRNGVQLNLFRQKGDPKDSPANGEARFEQVTYGPLTGLGDVAIIRILIRSGGSGSASELFVYEMAGEKPRLLWSFQSGDRADGGLREAYLRKGNLVLEIYKEGPNDPLCCASRFSRHYYAWRKGKLREFAKEEGLRVPESEFRADEPEF